MEGSKEEKSALIILFVYFSTSPYKFLIRNKSDCVSCSVSVFCGLVCCNAKGEIGSVSSQMHMVIHWHARPMIFPTFFDLQVFGLCGIVNTVNVLPKLKTSMLNTRLFSGFSKTFGIFFP